MTDWTERENKVLLAAGKMGGEYLQEIGKTDLAMLTQEEWLTFLQCVGGEVTRMFPFNDEIPF